jgi:hypothetical protein
MSEPDVSPRTEQEGTMGKVKALLARLRGVLKR